jgi:hypothetical protein
VSLYLSFSVRYDVFSLSIRIVELSQALDRKVEQLTAARGFQLEYVILPHAGSSQSIKSMLMIFRSFSNTNLRNQLDSKEAEIISLRSTITSTDESCVVLFFQLFLRAVYH